MTNIPLEAYEYVVNGKSALEWVMERQCVKTDKAKPKEFHTLLHIITKNSVKPMK
jgi:predicted helicase